MNDFIHNHVIVNVNLLKTAYQVSMAGAKKRFKVGFFELMPQLLFYLAQFVIVFAMFKVINGEVIPTIDLITFFMIMMSVDSFGDALLFKGLQEYVMCIRRGQLLYFVLTPGAPYLKVLLFRWDFPMLILGFIFMIFASGIGWIHYQVSPIYTLCAILFGVVVHVIITGAFHIIQAYFDPRMPIPLGSPATRLYTKPLHLVMTGGIALTVMTTIYPAYLITALPSMITTNMGENQLSIHYPTLFIMGLLSILVWMSLLNVVIKRTCKERQG